VFSLETERLLIRPWVDNADDRAAFLALTQDPEVMRYVHRGEPYSPAEVDEWFARQARWMREHDVCMGAMIEKATGKLVGLGGTQPLGTTGDFEIGWWLARDVWGRGYATEVGAAAMKHVLETLRHPRVWAIIDPPNEASKRVVARLGMHWVKRATGVELGHRKPEILVDCYVKERD
jgi:RimJ/RimL family protein N-acetyltransferase